MKGVFLDIETTGLDHQQHRPIDIACKIVDLETGEILGEYQSVVQQPFEVWEKRDPVSIEVNGYTWEQVQTGKEPDLVGEEVIRLFTNLGIKREQAVFICQNPSFDRAFFNQVIPVYTQESLNWPYHWLDLASMFWVKFVQHLNEAQSSYPKRISLSKNAIAEHYSIPPEEHPHLAINGVDHLIECYQAVMQTQWRS